MCTKCKNEIQKNCSSRIIINKQEYRKCASNVSIDNHNMDIHIRTKFSFNSSKKLKLILLTNLLVSLVGIFASFIITYKLHIELMQVQNEMVLLSKKLMVIERNRNQQQQHNVQYHEYDFVKEFPVSESSLSRLRRANRKRNENKRKRILKNTGLIGPWYPDNVSTNHYTFGKFHLTEGKCSIEVTEAALYFIYAQVYYITGNMMNSYSICVRSEGRSETRIIARCSTPGPSISENISEISCYTATVYSLKVNDRVYIQQTESNRTVVLRDGHSFLGFVRLSGANSGRKINSNT